ncbi:Ciliary basal body-associated, B9 protein, putative [Angomonas deanei]|uniref:Ciliary basal body-associated, B9 protein, putative n=1 Tax=Angomonas deanei TaxID=59799 RepID=A0A7G2CPC8_9TRYP|nr:Ciliary basal body-associated, B9 protein, putative [Angomonas deanei]
MRSRFFTRPTAEDFIDIGEEDFPVDPPQGPSRLAPVILRQHRKDHQPNHNMFFMWASGGLKGGPDSPDDPLEWVGEERVMCTVMSEKDEKFFSARPPLNSFHTLLVDSSHIYSFKLEANFTEESRVDPIAPLAVGEGVEVLAAEINHNNAILYAADENKEAARNQLKEAIRILSGDSNAQKPAERSAALQTVVPLKSKDFVAAPDKGRRRIFVYGVVERCLGIDQDCVFLKCQLLDENHPSGRGETLDGQCAPTLEGEGIIFTTQLSYAGRIIKDDFFVQVDHVFGVPFEYCYEDRLLPTSPLRLNITAYTEGAGGDGIQSPVGYCSVSLPTNVPGRHTVIGQLWTPKLTGKEFLMSTLIGGRPSLVDARQAGPPLDHRTGISSKEGMMTNNAGSVRVTVNIMHRIFDK